MYYILACIRCHIRNRVHLWLNTANKWHTAKFSHLSPNMPQHLATQRCWNHGPTWSDLKVICDQTWFNGDASSHLAGELKFTINCASASKFLHFHSYLLQHPPTQCTWDQPHFSLGSRDICEQTPFESCFKLMGMKTFGWKFTRNRSASSSNLSNLKTYVLHHSSMKRSWYQSPI